MRIVLAASSLSFAFASVATAQFTGGGTGAEFTTGSKPRVDPQVIIWWYVNDLNKLRSEALALRASEGGALTPATRDALQIKLDRLRAAYARNLRNNDVFYVDAKGNRVLPQLPPLMTAGRGTAGGQS